jgi:hypothetical protein
MAGKGKPATNPIPKPKPGAAPKPKGSKMGGGG